MKTGDVAQILSVSIRTVINWTHQPELERYFSAGARMAEGGARIRDYSPEDVLILNTISKRKTRTMSWDDVSTLIEAGERVELDPIGILHQAAITPAEHMNQLALAHQKITLLESQLEGTKDELERLRQALDEERDQSRQRENELYRQIGQLEAQLKMAHEQIE